MWLGLSLHSLRDLTRFEWLQLRKLMSTDRVLTRVSWQRVILYD